MRGTRPVRKRVFFGCEGSSEVSFATWAQMLADALGQPIWLDPINLRGGSIHGMVAEAIRARDRRAQQRGSYTHCFAMLDSDRLASEGDAASRALRHASSQAVDVLMIGPSMEGLLARMLPGLEARRFATHAEAAAALLAAYPDYRKGISARWLAGHFTLGDLRRCARHDEAIARLLVALQLD